MKDIKLSVKEIIICKREENDDDEFPEFSILDKSKGEKKIEKQKFIKDSLNTKDKCLISFQVSENMRKLCPSLPSTYYLKKERELINQNLCKEYRNKYGYYHNAEEKIISIINNI